VYCCGGQASGPARGLYGGGLKSGYEEPGDCPEVGLAFLRRIQSHQSLQEFPSDWGWGRGGMNGIFALIMSARMIFRIS
jgi:hypothetical protein